MTQVQYFNGVRFALTGNSKYFINTTLHERMHRYVWKFYNGEIPKGYDIHHKDDNRYNNDISNLECIEKVAHRKLHGRNLTDSDREWRRNNLAINARPEAIKWHKSEEGKKWHSYHAKECAKNWKIVTNICEVCGREFQSKEKPSKFCSGSCRQKYRRLNGLDNITVICCVCGKEFITNKYKHTKTCSKSCASIYGKQKG